MTQTRSKAALVLAGGGLTGAVYEVGALRAIDDLLVDYSVNDFDMYIGTSAGALVSSFIANGLSPNTILQIVDGSHPTIRPMTSHDIFNLNQQEILYRTFNFPQKMVSAWSHYLRHWGDMTLFDWAWSLFETMPSGFYDGSAIGRYIEHVLKQCTNCSNKFTEINHELYIVATDLDTGKRAIFSREQTPTVTISQAVTASSALPVIYKPIRINGRDYIDGGIRGNASLDIAIEHGAKVILCINPLVPYDNSDHSSIPFLGADGGYLSDKGMEAVAAQALRIAAHAGLHYHVKQLRRAHPEVDILLIEPDPTDAQMSFYNIMRYSARLTIAAHGFEAVTLGIAENFEHYRQIMQKHGIKITRTVVEEELQAIRASGYDTEIIREVMEAKASKEPTTFDKINQTLAELNLMLEEL